MKTLYFLAKVTSKHPTLNQYKIHVNPEDIHQFPEDNISEKIIDSSIDLVINAYYYFYHAKLDPDTKKVLADNATRIEKPIQEVKQETVISDRLRLAILDNSIAADQIWELN